MYFMEQIFEDNHLRRSPHPHNHRLHNHRLHNPHALRLHLIKIIYYIFVLIILII